MYLRDADVWPSPVEAHFRSLTGSGPQIFRKRQAVRPLGLGATMYRTYRTYGTGFPERKSENPEKKIKQMMQMSQMQMRQKKSKQNKL